MDTFQQLLGNPNPLQALLQAPPPPPVPDEDSYAQLPALQELQQGGGGGMAGPLAMLTQALGGALGGGQPGAQPMDEVPRPTGYVDDTAPAHDEDAPTAVPGLGPELQENLGLGEQPAPDEDAAAAPGAAPSPDLSGLHVPQAPVLDERSLYPSTKRAVLQGVVPGIAALIAGLTGGKMAAAGVMSGAARGNEQYNQQQRQMGLLKYEKAKQQYAREVATYNQTWQHAKDRATILSDLAKKAAEFDDPDAARQWLAAQRKIYAPFGVDAMDAMPGGVLPGAEQKIAKQASTTYYDALKNFREANPGEAVDIDVFNKSTIRFRGKDMTMAEVAAIGGVPNVDKGAFSSTKTDANAIFNDYVSGYRDTTGKEPDAEKRAEFRLQALQDFAKASAKPPDELQREIGRARLALMGLQRAKLLAGGNSDGISNLNPGQVRFGMNVQARYEKASAPFNLRAQAYDTINSLASGKSTSEGDIAMVFSWMKMLDPTSTVREGEQAQVRNARGVPDSVRMMYNNLITNNALSLTKQQKLEIVGGAHRLYSSLAKGQQQLFDNAGKQLRAYKIAPGLFLTPQGSVSDPASYRTLEVEDETRPLPASAGIAPKRSETASPIAPPQASDAARAQPTAAPKAPPPAAARASGTRPTTTAPTKIVKGKDGKLYQVFGTNPDGTLKAKPLDQYF